MRLLKDLIAAYKEERDLNKARLLIAKMPLYYEALEKIADGKSTKIYLPSNLQALASTSERKNEKYKLLFSLTVATIYC